MASALGPPGTTVRALSAREGREGRRRPRAGNAGYAAARSAAVGITTKMAREHLADNVRVNRGCPTNIPGAAHAALFLASDEAAWVTGIELVVDGGAEVSRCRGSYVPNQRCNPSTLPLTAYATAM